jgi:hypothetical protein
MGRSGACLGEIVESHKRDFEVSGDSIVFHIRLDNRTEDQGLKTEFRARRLPLHSAIVAEVRVESTFPRSRQIIEEILKDCNEEEKAKIAGGNAARIYHLN